MNRKAAVIFIFLALLAVTAAATGGCTPNKPADLERKYAGGASKFAVIDGVRTHYRDEGSGKPVLMIHGVVSSLHTWDGWADIFTKAGFRVIRYDVPGFGLTGPWNKEYSAEGWVEHIDSLMKQLGVDRFSIAGNSLGGYLAWKYTATHPDRVEKLLLLDAAAYPQELPGIIKLVSAPVVGNIATVITPKFVVDMNIREVYGDDSKITPEVMDRYYDLMMREGNREACREIFLLLKASAVDPSMSAGISTIKVPVMVMWGEIDQWTPVGLLENFKKDLPNAKYIIYKDVGHVPMEEIPAQSAKDAIEFLQSPKQ